MTDSSRLPEETTASRERTAKSVEVYAATARSSTATPVDGRRAITRAVVLGASPGTAMCPLSALRPRYLWPVASLPLCIRLLHLFNSSGVRSVVLSCTDAATREQSTLLMEQAKQLDMDFSLVVESNACGTAGALRVLGEIGKDEHVLVVSANMMVPMASKPLQQLVRLFRPEAAASLLVARPNGAGALDAIRFSESGRVHELRQCEDRSPASDWTSAGAWVLGGDAIRLIPPDGYYSIREQLLPELLRRGHVVYAAPVNCDSPPETAGGDYVRRSREVFAVAQEQIRVPHDYRRLAEQAWAAPTAVVPDGTRIVGRVLIGPNCRLEDDVTIHGPCSIGEGCRIGAGAVIERGVLWSDVHVGRGATVRDSIATDHVAIRPHSTAAYRILVSRRAPRAAIELMRHSANGDDAVLLETHAGQFASLHARPARDRLGALAKRTLDVTVALAVLAVIWPVMLAAAAAIRLESRGPVLFKQSRCTRGGRLFTMLKLRTMAADAEERQAALRPANEVDGPMFKILDDPRITRVGSILRKTCLDEVPQMINVLAGDMSLVGPRPLAPEEMNLAPAWRDLRLKVRPGITGLWQLNGRRQHAFSDWIKYDIEYVKHRSLRLDLKILLGTARLVLLPHR